jgi:hypothetical protein
MVSGPVAWAPEFAGSALWMGRGCDIAAWSCPVRIRSLPAALPVFVMVVSVVVVFDAVTSSEPDAE